MSQFTDSRKRRKNDSLYSKVGKSPRFHLSLLSSDRRPKTLCSLLSWRTSKKVPSFSRFFNFFWEIRNEKAIFEEFSERVEITLLSSIFRVFVFFCLFGMLYWLDRSLKLCLFYISFPIPLEFVTSVFFFFTSPISNLLVHRGDKIQGVQMSIILFYCWEFIGAFASFDCWWIDFKLDFRNWIAVLWPFF